MAISVQSFGECLKDEYQMNTDIDRREFRKNQHLEKKDFSAVETLLRMGHRKLELYSSPGVTNIH